MPPSNIGAPPSDREASTSGGSRAALEAVFRTEYPRLVAGLARMVGDLGLAQELAQDAVVAALEQWPISGVPRNCGAWLMAIGKRRAVDLFRRNQNLQRKYAELGRSLDPAGRADPIDPDTALDNDLGDDLLRLAFTTCHPVLGVPSRVALTLRLLGGLTTQEIARAYLVPEPTIAQRIVRAKKTLTTNKVPFEVPRGKEFLDRLPSVLEVLYLIFNEGYSATSSGDWMRPALCEDALRLGRILIGLVPDESEALGLVALMEIQASRTPARSGPGGEPVLLLDQDRSRWNHAAVERGLDALHRAEMLATSPGRYALQAAIAASHARASRPQDTDWQHIAGLYATLAAALPSPTVELNRAVALGMAYGAQAGLALVDQLTDLAALRKYHLLPSIRGDFLYKLGRLAEAQSEFERAAELTLNVREKEMSLARAAACVLE